MVGLALFGRAPLFLPARRIVIVVNPGEYSEDYQRPFTSSNPSGARA
jgi:hypothetical protein